MFASKTPRDLNRDEQPYVSTYDFDVGERYHVADPVSTLRRRFDPRPEFDHAQHNEPNPVLLSLRGRLKFQNDVHHPSTAPRIARTMLSVLDRRWPAIEPATPEQIDHARRVLTRLAALTEGANA